MERIDRVFAHEGALTGHQLEENRAEREQIRPRIDRITLDLLGCQVTGGAKDHPVSVARPRGSAGSCASFAMPKSRIFAVPDLVRKTFSGLRSRWTNPRAWAATRPLVRAEAMLRASAGASGPLPIGARKVSPSSSSETSTADRSTSRRRIPDDVGVVERCGDPGFLQEPFDRVPIAALRAGERLERDVSTEPRIGCPVDVSHSATSQQGHDPVGPTEVPSGSGARPPQIPGGEDQGRRFEKPVDRRTGGGELVGHLQQLRVLGGEGGSQSGALFRGRGQPRVVPLREDAPSLGVHSRPRSRACDAARRAPYSSR